MKDTAYFCPMCSNPTVAKSSLVGGEASCGNCGWVGTGEELRAVPFEHDFASPEQIAEVFTAEITTLIGKHLGLPLGHFLLKWGFLDRHTLVTDLSIYLRSVAITSVKAIFKTREGLVNGTIKRPAPKSAKKGLN